MTAFGRMCARVPVCDQQRQLINTGRTGDRMTQALAWSIVEAKEDGIVLALDFGHDRGEST